MPLRRSHRRARLGRLAALALPALLGIAGCSHDPPPRSARGGEVVHVVQPGETLWRISKRYGADLDDVVRTNGIRDVHDVPIGTRLVIPGARDPAGRRPVPAPAAVPPPRPAPSPTAVRQLGLDFAWPARGTLNSRFGGRRGKPHEGIDIGAPRGTPVRAAEAGKVIYSGRLGDYGNTVIVKHVGDFSTVYAHHHRNRVSKGQFVERGDRVGDVGRSGNASGHHLHFEIRQGQRAVDPLRYLP